jgi:hypothetical protein
MSHETASGIIGPVPDENRRTDVFLEAVSENNVSETEIKTRKILIGIFVGLAISLLIALGFLMLFRTPEHPPPPEPPRPFPIIDVPVEQPPNPPVVPEPILEEKIDDVPPPNEVQQAPTPEPTPTPAEPNQNANDILTTIERRMPGLVEANVPNIDIPEKLAFPILELNINRQSLIEFIKVMSLLTEIPMTLDIDEMKPHSLSVKTPLTVQFKESTAETILTETLATVGLQWIIADRQILIHPKPTTGDVDLTFDVSDFAEKTDDLQPDALAEIVRRLVCPDANVEVLPGQRLAVVQDENSRKSPQRQKDEILRFLEQLRAVRQLPPKTELRDERLAPDAFGWDRVMERAVINYYRAVPLSRVVAQLETMTKLTIIIDHQSFHRALYPYALVETTVQCNQGTVNDAIELSLAAVDAVALTYRIIDHQTLEITTAESARQPEKMVVEIHRYQLGEDETPEDIVRSLRSAAPESWGETQHGGDIVVDRPSSCLLVRQSQPAQRQIRLFLSVLEP